MQDLHHSYGNHVVRPLLHENVQKSRNAHNELAFVHPKLQTQQLCLLADYLIPESALHIALTAVALPSYVTMLVSCHTALCTRRPGRLIAAALGPVQHLILSGLHATLQR